MKNSRETGEQPGNGRTAGKQENSRHEETGLFSDRSGTTFLISGHQYSDACMTSNPSGRIFLFLKK